MKDLDGVVNGGGKNTTIRKNPNTTNYVCNGKCMIGHGKKWRDMIVLRFFVK
jgi:hypothetical protein